MTLDEWLNEQPRGAATRLAAAAGTTRQTVSHLRCGGMPSVHLALTIATATGGAVGVSDWPSKGKKRRRAA